MNKRKQNILSFFLGETFFLGLGYSLLFYYSGKDSWISIILGSFIGFFLILLLEAIKKRTYLYPLKHPLLFYLTAIIYHIFLFTQTIFILETFTSSFYLPNTPIWFLNLPLFFIIFKISNSNYKNIGKLGELLLPISIFLLSIFSTGIIKQFQISSFLPILTNDLFSILKGALAISTFITSPYFLFILVPLENTSFKKNYFINCLFTLILGVVIISVLGSNLIHAYRYPEYVILKEIKIFHFLENIENILAFIYLFNLFLTLSLCGINIKNSLPKSHQKTIFPFLLTILYFVSIKQSELYCLELFFYHFMPYIFLFFQFLFSFAVFLSYHKE